MGGCQSATAPSNNALLKPLSETAKPSELVLLPVKEYQVIQIAPARAPPSKQQQQQEQEQQPVQQPLAFNERFRVGYILGEGAFSIIREATEIATGVSYAVKIVDRAHVSADDESNLFAEARILRLCAKHPHIVRLLHHFIDPVRHFFVSERMTGGELFDQIVKRAVYTERDAALVMAQILSALAHLSARSIVHRDVKPENLLLDGTGDDALLKLADFGFAAELPPPPGGLKEQCGTPSYVAPEVLRSSNYRDEVDVWSAGVICFILLGGYPPFHDNNQNRLYMKIERGSFEFNPCYWGTISDDAKDLIRKTLVRDRSQRLTAAAALEHKWFQYYGIRLTDDGTGALTVDITAAAYGDGSRNVSDADGTGGSCMGRDERMETMEESWQDRFRMFNAKRKVRGAIRAVMMAQRLQRIGGALMEAAEEGGAIGAAEAGSRDSGKAGGGDGSGGGTDDSSSRKSRDWQQRCGSAAATDAADRPEGSSGTGGTDSGAPAKGARAFDGAESSAAGNAARAEATTTIAAAPIATAVANDAVAANAAGTSAGDGSAPAAKNVDVGADVGTATPPLPGRSSSQGPPVAAAPAVTMVAAGAAGQVAGTLQKEEVFREALPAAKSGSRAVFLASLALTAVTKSAAVHGGSNIAMAGG